MAEAFRFPNKRKEASNVSTVEGEEDTPRFERAPNAEEVEMLALANAIVLEEMSALGVANDTVHRVYPFPVSPDRLRIGSAEHPSFQDGAVGHIAFSRGNVVMSSLDSEELQKALTPNAKKILQFDAMLHEMIHAAGTSAQNKLGKTSRVGYLQINENDSSTHEHLRGFNEGLVETLAQEWSLKHREKIKALLHVDDADFEHPTLAARNSYGTEQKVVSAIVGGIAEAKKERPKEVRRRLDRGHFTGEMMHLRDVDTAFGKGSLRLLAAIRSTPLFDSEESSIVRHGEDITKNFSEESRGEFERDESARTNLLQEEYFLYLRRRYESAIDDALIMASAITDKLEKGDGRTRVLQVAFYAADRMSGAARRAYEYCLLDSKAGKEIRYPPEFLKKQKEYADKKRELLRVECKRLDVF